MDLFQGEKPTGKVSAENPFIFRMSELPPTSETKGGSVTIVDSTIFEASQTIAASRVVIHPGSARALHWHPNADEWQYFIAGKGRVGVFDTGPNANTYGISELGILD